MRLIRHALIALAFSVTALCAQTLDDGDRRQIEGLSMMFQAAFDAGDMEAVIGFLPQPIVDHIAVENGVSPGMLRQLMAQQTQQMMAAVTVERFDMDLDRLTPGNTETGRAYAVVPTTTVIALDGATYETTTDTLFFEDGGNWYLLRIENAAQIEILNAVYPDFASTDLR